MISRKFWRVEKTLHLCTVRMRLIFFVKFTIFFLSCLPRFHGIICVDCWYKKVFNYSIYWFWVVMLKSSNMWVRNSKVGLFSGSRFQHSSIICKESKDLKGLFNFLSELFKYLVNVSLSNLDFWRQGFWLRINDSGRLGHPVTSFDLINHLTIIHSWKIQKYW